MKKYEITSSFQNVVGKERVVRLSVVLTSITPMVHSLMMREMYSIDTRCGIVFEDYADLREKLTHFLVLGEDTIESVNFGGMPHAFVTSFIEGIYRESGGQLPRGVHVVVVHRSMHITVKGDEGTLGHIVISEDPLMD